LYPFTQWGYQGGEIGETIVCMKGIDLNVGRRIIFRRNSKEAGYESME
jgi:hypothetical protein